MHVCSHCLRTAPRRLTKISLVLVRNPERSGNVATKSNIRDRFQGTRSYNFTENRSLSFPKSIWHRLQPAVASLVFNFDLLFAFEAYKKMEMNIGTNEEWDDRSILDTAGFTLSVLMPLLPLLLRSVLGLEDRCCSALSIWCPFSGSFSTKLHMYCLCLEIARIKVISKKIYTILSVLWICPLVNWCIKIFSVVLFENKIRPQLLQHIKRQFVYLIYKPDKKMNSVNIWLKINKFVNALFNDVCTKWRL